MEDSYHCALTGDGALKFAEEKGFPVVHDMKQLITPRAKKMQTSYEKLVESLNYRFWGFSMEETDRDEPFNTALAVGEADSGATASAVGEADSGATASAVASEDNDESSSPAARDDSGDTVSAVARDINGHFACAVSTGILARSTGY